MALSKGFPDGSQKRLIAAYRESRDRSDAPIIYIFKRPYSAEFYSEGKARLAHDMDEAKVFSHNHPAAFFAVTTHDMDDHLPKSFVKRVSIVYRDSQYCLAVLNRPPPLK